MDSVLGTIKYMLGIPVEDTSFDEELIVHINSVLSTAAQLGVFDGDSWWIKSGADCWPEDLDPKTLNMLKQYVYLKVRLQFDPPTSGTGVMDSINNLIKEYEWRLNVYVDPDKESW